MKRKTDMKAKIAFIALALFSAQASAEWQFMGESHNGTKYFIDLSTKRQQGKYTLVWEMLDEPKPEVIRGKSFNSAKILAVYDCYEYRFGAKHFNFYNGKLGRGDVVHFKSVEMHAVDFIDVVPDTVGMTKFNRVCGKGK
jgi:hypothetical protein